MAKKTKPTPEGIFHIFYFFLNYFTFYSTVICLSDDDDDKMSIPSVTPIKQQSSPIVNGDKKVDVSQASDWIVQRKDIMRIPELSIKHSDLIKKPFELCCSAVRFGIKEFNVESEIILMKETEFELKLKSKISNRKKSKKIFFNSLGSFMNNLNVKLAYSDIISFYFSFQSQPPAAFIQVRPEFTELFAKFIPSNDEHGKGFDPNSKGFTKTKK